MTWIRRIRSKLRKREGAHDDLLHIASDVNDAVYVDVDLWQRNLITTILTIGMIGM